MTKTPLLLLLLLAFRPSTSTDLKVAHPFGLSGGDSLPWEQSLLNLNLGDESRLQYFNGEAVYHPTSTSNAPIASGRNTVGSSNYVVKAEIGTPPQQMLMSFDISNDAAWIPCKGCVGCPSSNAMFDTASTSTVVPVRCGEDICKKVPNSVCSSDNTCGFNMSYGSSTFTAALICDRLSIAGDEFPTYAFGCIRQTTGSSVPPQGLLGLGRGPSSLISQTQSTYQSTFSYCLPSFQSSSFSGSLRLGRNGQPALIKHTPLLFNPRRSSLYYVNMTQVRVGRTRINIPPNAIFDPSTGAGTILDSGTMFTRLVAPVYTAMRDEFIRQVGRPVTSLGGFDTCYVGPIKVPVISFQFTHMRLVLPVENTMIHSSSSSISCLAMAGAPDNVNSVVNVVASMQQQNYRFLFDGQRKMVGLARERCG